MDYISLEQQVEAFVRKTFEVSVEHQYPYHNLGHTVSVVEHAGEIAGQYGLKEQELFIVRSAAWFHDIGHLFGPFEGHEEAGVLVMEGYMAKYDVPVEVIVSMAGCIRATKFPSHPVSLYEEILCDADTYHFGTAYFRDTDGLVRKEFELRTGKTFPDWHRKSVWLLEHHRFFTEYCRLLLDRGKKENVKWLRGLPE